MTGIRVQQINNITKEDLLRLAEYQKFYPYDYIRGIDKSDYISYLCSDINKLLLRDTIFILSAIDNRDKVCGLLLIETLKWDTEIFGFPCARIHYLLAEENDDYEDVYELKRSLLLEAVLWAKRQNIKFMDICCHPLDFTKVKAIMINHFDLVATHIHHVWDFRKEFKLEHKITVPIRRTTVEDLNNLENIDFSIFPKHSRFYLDEKLMATGRVPVMFKHWLRNSVLGIRAKGVWIVEMDNQIVGYITTIEDEGTKDTLGLRITKVDMTGVMPFSRNKGIYKDMIATMIYWAQEYGADIFEVVSHVCNAPANSVTSQLQSRVCGAHYTFHWHAE